MSADQPLGTAASVSTEKAAQLLALANRIDPGLESISLGRDRAKHKRINDHAVAYGIRMALDELGLMPDE